MTSLDIPVTSCQNDYQKNVSLLRVIFVAHLWYVQGTVDLFIFLNFHIGILFPLTMSFSGCGGQFLSWPQLFYYLPPPTPSSMGGCSLTAGHF